MVIIKKALVALFLFCWFGIAIAEAPKLLDKTLSNGLRVILLPNHRSNAVRIETWYRVGAINEHLGNTGLSHLLEHMMFSGSHAYPHFFDAITKMGGNANAATTDDYTYYYETVSADHVSDILKMEANRMQQMHFTEAAFDREKKVVTEERRMRVEDNPNSTAWERLQAAAFVASPYHHPVIGWMHDIAQLTLPDVQRWYENWYAPNNATLVIVGDISPEKTFQEIEQIYSGIPARISPTLPNFSDIPPLGEKTLTLNVRSKLPWVLLAYPVPSLPTAKPEWHTYALDVMAALLSLGDSSQMQSDMVRGREVATDAGVYFNPLQKLSSIFVFYATPAPNHTPAHMLLAFERQIKSLQNKPISYETLQRVIAQLSAEKIYAQDSLGAEADQIGLLATLGLPLDLRENYLSHIRSVTPEQIQTVAKLYFKPKRAVSVIANPIAVNTREKS